MHSFDCDCELCHMAGGECEAPPPHEHGRTCACQTCYIERHRALPNGVKPKGPRTRTPRGEEREK